MDSILDEVNQKIPEILNNYKNLAVVGISSRKDRPSNSVANYLKQSGYNIIPINPGSKEILDLRCYPSLKEADQPIDVVVIFRRPEDIPPIAKAAVEIGAKAIWIQQGLVSEEAAKTALEAGLDVVMDKCMKVEHMRRGIK